MSIWMPHRHLSSKVYNAALSFIPAKFDSLSSGSDPGKGFPWPLSCWALPLTLSSSSTLNENSFFILIQKINPSTCKECQLFSYSCRVNLQNRNICYQLQGCHIHIRKKSLLFCGGVWPHPWHVKVPGLGIKPAPWQQPKWLQWQRWVINLLYHKGTPKVTAFWVLKNISVEEGVSISIS